MILNKSIEIPHKCMRDLIMSVKRGLSSYYLQKEGYEIPFINIRDVKNGRINADTVERVHIKETEALVKSRIEPNDVIISIKGTRFKAAIADEPINDYIISANLIAFRLKKDLLPEIVVAYLNSPNGQKKLRAKSAGAVQKSLNLKSLMEIKIPIPDIKNQKLMAKYFLLSKEYTGLIKKEQELRKKINDDIILKCMR